MDAGIGIFRTVKLYHPVVDWGDINPLIWRTLQMPSSSKEEETAMPCHLLSQERNFWWHGHRPRSFVIGNQCVLRDLNSCLTAGGLIISSKWNYTGPSVLFLDLGWKKQTKKQTKKHVQHYLNWDNFLEIDLDWSQSSLSEGLLKCQLSLKEKETAMSFHVLCI